MSNLTVAVDAGHGLSTAGKRSAPFVNTISHSYGGKTVKVTKGEQFKEHAANAGIAFYIAKLLSEYGVTVVKTGFNTIDGQETDLSITTRQRSIMANQCDYSISCHNNAAGSATAFQSANGIETLYDVSSTRVGDSKKLANCIQKRVQAAYNQKNRGAKSASGLGMCNATGMGCTASVLVEYCFMDNQAEAEKYLCNPEAWYRWAKATVDGFIDYLVGTIPTDPLKQGEATKAQVMYVQMKLNKILGTSITVDGIWGTQVKNAIIKLYQVKGWGSCQGTYLGAGSLKTLANA